MRYLACTIDHQPIGMSKQARSINPYIILVMLTANTSHCDHQQ